MLRLFSKNQQPVIEREPIHTAVKDRKAESIAMVKKIHAEFNEAGEIAIKEVRNILSKANNDYEKGKTLSEIGFGNTPLGSKYHEMHYNDGFVPSAILLEKLQEQYPLMKFITKSDAEKVCQKYGLLIGASRKYIGEIPDKNIADIQRFLSDENEISTAYYLYTEKHGSAGRVSKESYEEAMEGKRSYKNDKGEDVFFKASKHRPDFLIAAPQKDFIMDNVKVVGVNIVAEDPIVMVECFSDDYHAKVYCIVTAWGDEASDEMVVNQKMN